MSNRERSLYLLADGIAANKLSLDDVLRDSRVDDSEIPALLEIQVQEDRNLERLECYLLGFQEAMQLLSHGELSGGMRKRLAARGKDVQRTYGKDRSHLTVIGPDYDPEPPMAA